MKDKEKQKKKKKSRYLSIFLIKKQYKEYKDFMKDEYKIKEFKIKDSLKIDGKIIIGETKSKKPAWIDFLKQGTNKSVDDVFNSSNRALILINHDRRIFAISFGYGRYLLKEDSYERDFGLKVVLNAIDPKKIRSMDIAHVEDVTVQKRIQISRSVSQEAFGLDIFNDLMRVVTGEPDDNEFGKNLTGSDALLFNTRIDFKDILPKIASIYNYYKSEKYKQDFDWVDNLIYERDPAILAQLNNSLIEAIKTKNEDKMHLAPPEPVNWSDISGFGYSKNKENLVPDINIIEFINSIRNLNKFNLDKLKKKQLYIQYASNDEYIPKWKIYDCIVFETTYNSETYVLTIGKWFLINKDFVKSVTNYVNHIKDSRIKLPDCESTQHEGEYNKAVVTSNKQFFLLDENLIKSPSARTPIEFCDLLTSKKQLIHIKNKKSSSTLSHLFSQARISAEVFLKDELFRDKLKARLMNEIDENILNELVPDGEIDSKQYEIVIAIIDTSTKGLVQSLPFFSLVNMRQCAEYLKLLRFKVTKCKILKIMFFCL